MGFVIKQKTRPNKAGKVFTYVHFVASSWSGKHGQARQKRVYLGKLCEDGASILVDKVLAGGAVVAVDFEEIRTLAKDWSDAAAGLKELVGARGGTVQAPATGAAAPAWPSVQVNGVATVGDVHVLDCVVRGLELPTRLTAAFGEKDAAALLGLAMFQVAEGRAAYLACDWLGERELPVWMSACGRVDSEAVSALMHRVGASFRKREQFFRSWLADSGTGRAIVYDTTSLSTYATSLLWAEYGYNRDGESLPQINVALVSAAGTGRPLWYRSIPGSVPDVRNLRITQELLQEFGLDHATFCLDRGFYSASNLKAMLKDDIGFTIGVPFSLDAAKRLVRRHARTLASPKTSFMHNGHLMRHVSDSWEVKCRAEDGGPRTLDVHLYMEPARQSSRETALETTVLELETKAGTERFTTAKAAREWLKENAGVFASCFTVARRDGQVGIRRSVAKLEEAAQYYGYTLILTTREGVSGEDTLAEYRGRDMAEKLFDTLKNENGQNRLRTGNDDVAEGRLFLAFLSLILNNDLEQRLRRTGILKKMTIAQFLATLRKIKAVTTEQGTRYLLDVPKKCADLLAVGGFPPPHR